VDNADVLAFANQSGPWMPCRHNPIVACGFGLACRGQGLHGHRSILRAASVFRNARKASSLALRQKSSADGGGERHRITRTGSAFQEPGAKGCGQFESATIRFISARRSRYCPGESAPLRQTKRPSLSVITGAKNVTQGPTSRGPKPCFEAARTKLSRVLR